MKAESWKELIQQAAYEASTGSFEKLDLLAKYLEMCDEAKQELRNKSYGWTGLDVLETVKEVPQNAQQSVRWTAGSPISPGFHRDVVDPEIQVRMPKSRRR